MIKISYIDFWCERKGDNITFDDINNITSNIYNMNCSRELIQLNEGVGLFHIDKIKTDFPNYNIIITEPNNADLLICSCFGNLKLKYPNKTKIFLGFESVCKKYVENSDINTYCFSSFSTNNNYNFGLYFIYRGFNLYKQLKQPRQLYTKTKFCICIVSNEDASFRKEFVMKLMEYKKVDCYGKLFKNCSNDIIETTSWYNPHIMDIIKDYKFMICMENTQVDNYWTEKIINGYIGNTIPIYWGDPNICDIFNSESFININKLGINSGIERIKELDNNTNYYDDMFEKIPITNNKHESYYDIQNYKLYMNNIFSNIICKKNKLTNDMITNFNMRLVINLDRRKDRYDEFCKNCPFDPNIITRVSGVDGNKLDKNTTMRYKMEPGAVGCFMSHYKAWEMIASSEMDDNMMAIIFEDDNMFSDRFSDINNIMMLKNNNMPIICYIGGRFNINFIPSNIDNDISMNIYTKINNNLYMRPKNKYLITQYNNWIFDSSEDMINQWERCCSCIIMNKMAAKLLVKYITCIPDIAVDNFLFKINSFTNMITYYDYFPHLCYSPLNYKSDIR